MMQRPLLRASRSRFLNRKFLVLSVVTILAGVILLFARGKPGEAHDDGASPSAARKQKTAYRNRSVVQAPRLPGRPEESKTAITGHVYGTDGIPIPGATVVAATFEIAGNIPSHALSVRSDQEGRFELPLKEGTYQLIASKEGYGPTATMAHTGDTSSLIMPRSGVIIGRIYDEQRNPVRHFTIDVISAVPGDMPTPPPLWSRSFDSADGSFRVEQIPGWEVLIRATAEGYATTLSPPIDLEREEVFDLEMTLTRGCVLSGRVEDREGAAQPRVLVDAEARLVSSALIDPSVPAAAHVESEMDGTFRLENVPEGEVTVRAYDGSSAAASITVQISDCEALAPVTLVLSSGGSLAGVARRPDGAPLSNARLSLIARSIGIVNTTSDEEGRFRFDEIPDGPARLELHHEGRGALLFVGVTEGEVTTQDITLFGDGASELRGRVTAAGKPLSGVKLMIAGNHGHERGMGMYHPVTDAEGNYRVPSMLPGNYVVGVLSTSEGRAVNVKDGDVATLNIDVSPRTAFNRDD